MDPKFSLVFQKKYPLKKKIFSIHDCSMLKFPVHYTYSIVASLQFGEILFLSMICKANCIMQASMLQGLSEMGKCYGIPTQTQFMLNYSQHNQILQVLLWTLPHSWQIEPFFNFWNWNQTVGSLSIFFSIWCDLHNIKLIYKLCRIHDLMLEIGWFQPLTP